MAIARPLGLLLALAALAGCAARPVSPGAADPDAIRARAEAHFDRAFYLKPAAASGVATRAQQLAPLLILEAPGTNMAGRQTTADAPTRIFFQPGEVTLNGRRHAQMTYWWTYPRSRRAHGEPLAAQGVRLTLNAAGLPAIWEVLADTTGAEIIFVSQNLEAQAVREFGAPVAGRRFSLERPLDEAPNTVVARVLEDGPVAMGPIVYLRAGSRDVTTVICRCMESQARELAGQQEYELQPPPDGLKPPRFRPPAIPALRLPAGF